MRHFLACPFLSSRANARMSQAHSVGALSLLLSFRDVLLTRMRSGSQSGSTLRGTVTLTSSGAKLATR